MLPSHGLLTAVALLCASGPSPAVDEIFRVGRHVVVVSNETVPDGRTFGFFYRSQLLLPEHLLGLFVGGSGGLQMPQLLLSETLLPHRLPTEVLLFHGIFSGEGATARSVPKPPWMFDISYNYAPFLLDILFNVALGGIGYRSQVVQWIVSVWRVS